MKRNVCTTLLVALTVVPFCVCGFADETSVSADELIANLIDQTRGDSSYSEMTMQVKRPGWERNSEFSVWTRGREDALIRFTAPVKDAGSATLKVGDKMWTYSPEIRRSIRLPKSLMSQDWQGSDFSYNDLSRSDKLLQYYTHNISKIEKADDFTIYTIDSTPHEDAPIVWGMERIVIRDDWVLLSQTYFDQEMNEVKSMRTLEVLKFGDRFIPARMRMSKADEPDSWTEVAYVEIDFDRFIDDRIFTLFALRGER